MTGFHTNIEKDSIDNTNFRKVLYSGKHSQLVLMSLKPNEDIGLEVHADNDQFFRVEQGEGKCVIDGNEYQLGDGSAIVVPAVIVVPGVMIPSSGLAHHCRGAASVRMHLKSVDEKLNRSLPPQSVDSAPSASRSVDIRPSMALSRTR